MTINDVIATDHPLTPQQRQTLSALLDTLVPASDDGNMPSAQVLDFIGYLNDNAADFVASVVDIVGHFDGAFAGQALADRVTAVEAFSKTHPALFGNLLLHTYACYYQDDRVLEGIGEAAGPPFPRGNTVEVGDLSLLDPVVRQSRTYRKLR